MGRLLFDFEMHLFINASGFRPDRAAAALDLAALAARGLVRPDPSGCYRLTSEGAARLRSNLAGGAASDPAGWAATGFKDNEGGRPPLGRSA